MIFEVVFIFLLTMFYIFWILANNEKNYKQDMEIIDLEYKVQVYEVALKHLVGDFNSPEEMVKKAVSVLNKR